MTGKDERVTETDAMVWTQKPRLGRGQDPLWRRRRGSNTLPSICTDVNIHGLFLAGGGGDGAMGNIDMRMRRRSESGESDEGQPAQTEGNQ